MAAVKLTLKERLEICKLYKLGWPVQDIAKRFGVSHGNVCHLAKRRGLLNRRPKAHPEAQP